MVWSHELSSSYRVISWRTLHDRGILRSNRSQLNVLLNITGCVQRKRWEDISSYTGNLFEHHGVPEFSIARKSKTGWAASWSAPYHQGANGRNWSSRTESEWLLWWQPLNLVSEDQKGISLFTTKTTTKSQYSAESPPDLPDLKNRRKDYSLILYSFYNLDLFLQ